MRTIKKVILSPSIIFNMFMFVKFKDIAVKDEMIFKFCLFCWKCSCPTTRGKGIWGDWWKQLTFTLLFWLYNQVVGRAWMSTKFDACLSWDKLYQLRTLSVLRYCSTLSFHLSVDLPDRCETILLVVWWTSSVLDVLPWIADLYLPRCVCQWCLYQRISKISLHYKVYRLR